MPRNFTSEDFNDLPQLQKDILSSIKYSTRGFAHISTLISDLRRIAEFQDITEGKVAEAIETLKEQALVIEHQTGYFKIDREDVHYAIDEAGRLDDISDESEQ